MQYFLACKSNINRKNYHYQSLDNISKWPKNMFQKFPPVYCLTIDESDNKSVQSMVNIKLAKTVYQLDRTDQKLLREYKKVSEEYNYFIQIKKRKKQDFYYYDALYKYWRHVENVPEKYNFYKTKASEYKQEYQKYQHFDRAKLNYMDDLYQHFLMKI